MRRRPAPAMVGVVPAALVAVSLCASVPARADEDDDTQHYTLRAELGGEYDSNAHRTEVVAGAVDPGGPVDSLVARGVLTGTLSDVVAAGHAVAISATAAGKLFQDSAVRDEDVAIAQSSAAWRATLGDREWLTLSGVYYEAFQRPGRDLVYVNERRDFQSLTPTLRLAIAVASNAELAATAGYRLFVFKPDRDFDFRAPTAAIDLRWAHESADGAADWDLGAGVSYERRAFGGPVLVPSTMGAAYPPVVGDAPRVDHFLMARADAVWTGPVLAGVGYAFHDNISNSFTDTVARHFITGRFATRLPLDLYLAARAELLIARYADPVAVGQVDSAGRSFASIEDENRSNARADLSRNLSDRVQLIARYTFYANALGASPVTYRRHTMLLSLAFTFEK